MTTRLRTSVLINNYNNGPYLDHCLSSVFAQEIQPDEVIVYDDGSTDESLQVLANYGSKINLIARSHRFGTSIENQAVAIETAFRSSTGEIIFLLDGDDAFLPGKIAAYVAAFLNVPSAVMVQAPLEKIDERGRRIGIEYEPARHQSDYLEHIYAENELNIYYPTSALAFRRSYLEPRLPVDFSDGLLMWSDARLALIAPLLGPVVALPRPYSQWRRHLRSHTVISQDSIYRLVKMNQAYFNAFCRATGRRTISPWRSHHHRLRWIRHFFIPDRMMNWFRAIRWATLSAAKKQHMLAGPDPTEIERELEKLKRQGLEAP